MRNLERFRQSSMLSKKPSALFPPKPSVMDTLLWRTPRYCGKHTRKTIFVCSQKVVLRGRTTAPLKICLPGQIFVRVETSRSHLACSTDDRNLTGFLLIKTNLSKFCPKCNLGLKKCMEAFSGTIWDSSPVITELRTLHVYQTNIVIVLLSLQWATWTYWEYSRIFYMWHLTNRNWVIFITPCYCRLSLPWTLNDIPEDRVSAITRVECTAVVLK